MNTKQKLSYMVVGGIIGVVGVVIGMSVLSVSTAWDKFGEIECTSLTVVDKDGRSVAEISAFKHGGIVRVRGYDGVSRVALSVGENGGVVAVSDNDGMPRASLYVKAHGGVVTVRSNDGKSGAAVLHVNEYGNGVLSLWDKHGYPLK